MIVHKFCPIMGSSYTYVEERKQPLITPFEVVSNAIKLHRQVIGIVQKVKQSKTKYINGRQKANCVNGLKDRD